MKRPLIRRADLVAILFVGGLLGLYMAVCLAIGLPPHPPLP